MTKVRIITPTYEDRYKQIEALEQMKKKLEAKYKPVLERTDAYRKAARGLWTDAYMEYRTETENIDTQIRAIEKGEHAFIMYLNKRRREDAK